MPSPAHNLTHSLSYSLSLLTLNDAFQISQTNLHTFIDIFSCCSAGEYEYIEVVSTDNHLSDRLIVDVDFQAQFEIARPTPQYESALKALPPVFVGSASKLRKILEFMSDAAKISLKQNHMHLPPWRTLDYMSSKWLSPCDRKKPDLITLSRLNVVAKQCSEQLRHTKIALVAEMKASSGNAVSNLSRTNKACPTKF